MLNLVKRSDGVGYMQIVGGTDAVTVKPAGVNACVDAALDIRGKGITDDQCAPRSKIGDGGGYLIEKSLFGLGATHLL